MPFDLALEHGDSVPILVLLQPGSVAWSKKFQPGNSPLVTAEEMRVFESLSHLLDPNPRRLKRIISVYALVAEVAKRMPLSEVDSTVYACRFVLISSHSARKPHRLAAYSLLSVGLVAGCRKRFSVDRVPTQACQVALSLRELSVPNVISRPGHHGPSAKGGG